jgi:hypothetical protein
MKKGAIRGTSSRGITSPLGEKLKTGFSALSKI